MNGPHDVGGMQNFGPVPYYKTGPVFHEVWEGRVYALNRALAPFRRVTGYPARAQSEQWNSADYYRMSYYERWFQRMVERIGELVNCDLPTLLGAPEAERAEQKER